MEDLPVPLSRVERFLAKACGMDVNTPEPGPGIEPFLYAIAYNTTPPVAGYRTEEWLAYVQGVTPAKPLELEGSCIIGNQKVDVKYFAVAAGMPGVTLPEKPQNRKEKYWEYIATHRPTPGVLKYTTGTNITLTDVVRGIEELQYVYGDTVQNGTPTPDAPVAVQTVTGEQTVTISDGVNSHNYTVNLKTANLFDSSTAVNGTLQANGTVNTGTIGYSTTDFIEIDSSLPIIKTATVSPRVKLYDSSKNVISTAQYNDIPNFNTSGSHDITYKNAKYIRFSIYLADYPLDGVNIYQPIELAKIGTYQDYIYKSGSDWYVHKETDSVTYDGSENWTVSTTFGRATTPKPNSNWVSWGNSPSTYASKGFSNYVKAGNTSDSGLDNVFNVGTTDVFVKATSAGTNINAATWKTWLNTHNLVCYAILATPTDTKITDATLIGQLNAIDSAVLPKPIAYITVGATDPNLPGPLKISYYGEEE